MSTSLRKRAPYALPVLLLCFASFPEAQGGEPPTAPSDAPHTLQLPKNVAPLSPSANDAGAAPKATSEHLKMGVPTDADAADDYLMVKPQYALAYNKNKNVANWVSYSLNASHFGDVPRYNGKFLTDQSLPPEFYRVKHEDYVGSGFDRGHMVRSEERTRSPEDNKATFLMTNILPQYHDLNAGPWLRLEAYCQDLAQKQGRQLYVIAGGIFNGTPATIGKGVAVPTAFFKIVVVLDANKGAGDVTKNTRVIGVIMPNQEGIMSNGWEGYRTTVDEIEKRTGYDFLSGVSKKVQKAIESRVDKGA